ncbi:MAG: Cyclohex-1-ene-1-carbonyl-CoA dehydrogenase [Acidimicrobiales bacterium]|nr:MAG: acyl-CoA dehydrogenase family protein [Actinomycetota bacterium]MBV6507882.1 Cyclohex-1-ene-1-carbonyl-CoA dehydrogenase [Acidimicrobiales bacterium]RIK06026.1 MAG: acyl-CoA dehydrogenase [Acidobacteriota bacterium]
MYTELDTGLTPEQVELKEQTHRFAAEVLRPAAAALDALDPEAVIERDSVFWDVYKKAYEIGLHLTFVPEAAGGNGLGPVEAHIVLEELGWGSSDFAVGLLVAATPFAWVAQFAPLAGNAAMLDEVVKPFVNDQEARFVGCLGVTEPGHGSDLLSIATEHFTDLTCAGDCRARPDGDEWVISGQKASWVTNGTIGNYALMFVTIDPTKGPSGGGMAFVPLDVPGVKRGKPWDKHGKRAMNQGEIFFDDVRIPREYMFVEPATYAMALEWSLTLGNGSMGAIYTGVARAAFEEALEYAKVRVQGGKPIADHQLVAKKLFDMFVQVEQARALSRAVVAYNMTMFPPKLYYANAVKVACTQAAYQVANDAVQVFGAIGLTREMPVELLLRDARMGLIEDGTNEFLSLVGARNLIEDYKV